MVSVKGRRFACAPVALMVFVVDEEERVLLLRHPSRDTWEPINGALEADETLLEGALRETREEAGESLQVRPLGTVHASSFHYDERVRHMISLGFVMAAEGGTVVPGDDMAGSEVCWCSLAELGRGDVPLWIPHWRWEIERAVELYRLWRDEDVELQPPL